MKTKRTVSLLLCLCLLVSLLAGCGGANAALLYPDARVVVDGIVHEMDIYAAKDRWYLSAADMTSLFSADVKGDYVDLAAYAEGADIRYTKDEALNAVYFNTWEPYNTRVDFALFGEYLSALGLSAEDTDKNTITGKEMTVLLDALVSYAAPEALAQWQIMCPTFRKGTEAITRMDAMAAIFLATYHIGGNYADIDYSYDTVSRDMMELMQSEESLPDFDYFGQYTYNLDDFGLDHCGIGAICYNLINLCSVDGSYPMAYDRETNSFRMNEPATYEEALMALLRVMAMRSGSVV